MTVRKPLKRRRNANPFSSFIFHHSSLLTLAALTTPVLLFGMDFVWNGKAMTGIAAGSDEPGVKLGIQELTEYTKKVTGVAPAADPKGKILIGTLKTANLPAEIRKTLEKNPSDEAFYTGTKNGIYYIIGKNGVAAYYGACDFMEKYLGVRWYYPGKSGERYPLKKDVILPEGGRVEAPVFSMRLVNQVSAHGLCREGRSWAAHNRLQAPGPWEIANQIKYRSFHEPRLRCNRITLGGHLTFNGPVSKKKYGKTHPEYFALVDGKRTVDLKEPHHCISNPEVQELVYQYIIKLIDKYGAENFIYNFGWADTGANCCECEECRKLDGGPQVNYSRRFHTVAQKISKRVWAARPNANLSQWAYLNYRDYPEGLTLDPRTKIYYCASGRCYAHALDDPNCLRNKKTLERIREWQKVCKTIWTYEYSFAVGGFAYQPYSEVCVKDMKTFRKMGLIGRKEEIVFPDSSYFFWHKKGDWYSGKYWIASHWQFWYLLGRACWNPDFDYEKELAKAESEFYGKLYPAMKKYNDLRRKLWKEATGCVGWPYGDQRTPTILQKPGAKEELLKYLVEAEKLAGQDTELKKIVDFEKQALTEYWIKANEKYRKSLSHTASAPTVAKAPNIDGDKKDSVWGQACYLTDFRDTFGKKEPVPDELAISVGILSDKENLYFLIQAKDPDAAKLRVKGTEQNKDGIWKDEAFEIFIAPPNYSMKYYQFAVNVKGVIREMEQPGNNMNISLGATAKTKITKDGYVIELKVPVKRMDGVFAQGAMWKVHAARNYRGNRSKYNHFSLDGTEYHGTTNYRSLTIGKPLILNGTFEEGMDKKGNPKFWGFNKGKGSIGLITTDSNNHAVRMTSWACASQILYGKCFLPSAPKKVALIFKAKGKGQLWVVNARFEQILNEKGKRVNHFLGGKMVGKFALTDKETIYTAEYTIPAKEFSQLRFQAIGKNAECVLDDVSVREIE